jgi:hypothetical protein
VSAPLLIGTVLAIGALAFVLYPLFGPADDAEAVPRAPAAPVGGDAVEAALEAFRAGRPACPACGVRPEADAVYCSNCGRRLAPRGGTGGGGAATP